MNRIGMYALINKGVRIFKFFLIFIIFFIFSCSPARHLAGKFIKSNDTIKILLLHPDYVYKENFKINKDSIPEQIRDSVCISKSILLKNVDDGIILNLLFSCIKSELEQVKFKVYTNDDINKFNLLDSNAFIFNNVQDELDEYNTPYTFSQFYENKMYHKVIMVNTARINLWYEVSKPNSKENLSKLLFCADSIYDDVDCYIKKINLTKDVKFIFKRKDIDIDDLYDELMDFSVTNSDYIFDYFMNKYINEKYTGKKNLKYFHYDKQQKKVYPAKDKRFVFM